MRHLKIHTGHSKNEQALLLFDDASGVLIAFLYLTDKQVFEEPPGIWIIDMNSKFPIRETATSITRLIKNTCLN